MTAADLLTTLTTAGCHLVPAGEQLRVQAPPGALTDERWYEKSELSEKRVTPRKLNSLNSLNSHNANVQENSVEESF
jgi:hypothetical protein